MYALLPFILLSAAVDIWTEPSFVDVIEAGKRSRYAAREGVIYAAQGELESLQLCVHARKTDLDGLWLECDPVSEGIGRPEIYLIGQAQAFPDAARVLAKGPSFPDVLEPMIPISLAEGRQVAYWILYRIPEEAAPGSYRHSVRVCSEGRRAENVEVRLEVFDFALPQPALPVLGTLDRGAMASIYGLENRALEDWKGVYDFLGGYKLSYSLWGGDNLVQIQFGGVADTEALREHLGYAVAQGQMGCIELGGGGEGLSRLTLDSQGEDSPDPLGQYMAAMSAWLREKGYADRATMMVAPPVQRSGWEAALAAYGRASKQEARIPRLFVGPPHPIFERYVDRWAMPFRCAHPDLIRRFHLEYSMAETVLHPPVRVAASGCGKVGSATVARDAADGSRFTAWRSAKPPSSEAAVWWEAGYSEAQVVNEVQILWAPGWEAEEIEVQTSYDGELFTPATVAWDHAFARKYNESSSSVGRFKYENTLLGIRFVFKKSRTERAIGVEEIYLDPQKTVCEAKPIPSIQPWLSLEADFFPSLSVGAHPLEARLIPWVCHTAHLRGAYIGGLNQWPAALKKALPAPGTVWPRGKGDTYLVYPGASGLLPSIRLLRLCDGIEDYAYLRRHAGEGNAKSVFLKSGPLPALPQWGYASPEKKTLEAVEVWLWRDRIRLGRSLGRGGSEE